MRIVVLVFCLLVSFSAARARAAPVHVSPGGDDANEGTQAKPLATLQGARDRARLGNQREPATVIVHAGTYVQGATLELSGADSGTTWRAAGDGEVRISGGPALAAEAFAPVRDAKILERLPAAGRASVVKIDLSAVSRAPLGGYPQSFHAPPPTPELFFNDRRMTVARWPNKGWATIEKIIDAGSVPREGDKSGRVGVFQYSGDEPGRWNPAAGVWLHGYWCFDWYDETIQVQSIDREKKQITLAAPALYGVKQGNPSPRRFAAVNLLEELDEPGEFYIDHVGKTLYFWPPAPIAGARIALSLLDAPLLRIKEANSITVSGMTFEDTLASGVEILGGRGNSIRKCTVRNLRGLGIRVAGGTDNVIDRCDITDTGTGGITLQGGDRKTLTPAHHQASNNHIWDFSRLQLTGAYAIVFDGVGNRAAHNVIHDAPHQAVLIGGNDHVFEFNIVRNVVTETDDAGGVYKGRNPSCRGNVIRSNFFSDIGSAMGTGTGAIYFDDGDGGDLVSGNIFLRCGNPGGGPFGTIFSHGGYDIRAENNIFIDCKRALGSLPWNDAGWKAKLAGAEETFWPEKLLTEVDITKPPYTTRYPEIVGFMEPPPATRRVNHARNNVLVRVGEVKSGNWECTDNEVWQTADDPGFVNMAAGDFRLRDDAEVFKHLPAFVRIPFEKIGPQKE
jgi:hypothetical protein